MYVDSEGRFQRNVSPNALTADLDKADHRPYFLWDEKLTVKEFPRRLHSDDEYERRRLFAKLLREARDIDVWEFVTPQEVADELPHIRHRLGRRLAFWEFLIGAWKEDGFVK